MEHLTLLEPVVAAVRPTVQQLVPYIPGPVVDQATNLLGRDCFNKLVVDFEPVSHPECIKLAISKGLSLGIVGSAMFVKLPQLFKLATSGSAEGLSFVAYALETVSQIISTAYSAHKNLPFTTYGETALIAIQNIIISTVILHLNGKVLGASAWVGLVAASIVALYSNGLVPANAFNALQGAAGILSIASKVPQIWTIFSERSTGQLSAVAVFSYLFGTFSRIFTTLQEVNDPLILWGFIASAVLNVILALQMVYYWNAPSPSAAPKAKAQSGTASSKPVPLSATGSAPGSARSTGTSSPGLRRRAP